MFTSRAEFRLHLRIDNADRRLTPHGRRVGLINDAAWAEHLAKQERMKAMRELLERTRVNEAVVGCQLSVVGEGRRPAILGLLDRGAVGRTNAGATSEASRGADRVFAPVLMKLMPEFFERNASTKHGISRSSDCRSSARAEALRRDDNLNEVELELRVRSNHRQPTTGNRQLISASRRKSATS